MEHPDCQSDIEGKKKAGSINFPDFKVSYKATVRKTV